MAQNFSYFQNQLQNGVGGGQPAVPGTGGGNMPASPAQSMGIDPQQLAMAQQLLANPNAMDAFAAAMNGQAGAPGAPPEFKNPFGDPKMMLVGGLAGIPVSMALEKLHGADHGQIAKIAQKLDQLPGIRQVSDFLENNVLSRVKGEWADEMLQRAARAHGADAAIAQMQARQIVNMTQAHVARNPGLVNALRSVKTFEAFSGRVDDEILKILKGVDTSALSPKLAKKVQDALAAGTVDRKVIDLAKKVADANGKETVKLLAGFHRGVRSLTSHYLPMFSDQAVMAQKLGAQNVGPIGRMFASTSNYIRRMFGGEVMKHMPGMGKAGQMAAQEGGSGLLGKMLGPFLAGFISIGSALSKAKEAPAGEKVSTFFHDFLGFGVGTLIGMELGAKFLRGPIAKLLGKKALSTPLAFLKFIPGIGPWLAGVTAVGFVTQILAMTVAAEPFKRAGEWIAHRIFGKPSQETLDKIEGKTKDPAQPVGNNNQPLNRINRFENLRQSIRGSSPATTPGVQGGHAPAGANQNFSLTPDAISQSAAAMRSSALEQEVINAPWNPHGFNPAQGH